MKGIIPICLSKLVIEKFGKDKWKEIMKASGLREDAIFLAHQDVDDSAVMTVLEKTCNVLGITLDQAADAFGEYWVSTFAKKVYKDYYKNITSAKEFLLNMDHVHKEATDTIENAHPPQFEYEEPADNILIMKYISQRGLIDIFIGLIKGVGKHFNEELEIEKLEANKAKITFL